MIFIDDNENVSLLRLNRELSDNALNIELNTQQMPTTRSQSPKSALANKLHQLEKKQYELTKQVKNSFHFFFLFSSINQN